MQSPPLRAERPAPANGLLASRPPEIVDDLSAYGFAVSIGDDLDVAAPCVPPGVTADERRAYAVSLYPTLEVARQRVPRRFAELARGWSDPKTLARHGPLEFHIHRVAADGFCGRDYCEGGCAIPDAAEQLRFGDHNTAAWREILRLRAKYKLEGAKLKGRNGEDVLFLFANAPCLEREHVETVTWPKPAGE